MSKPRTVTRFIEETITLGQIAYEAYRRRRVGILCAWSDLDDESRAEWEAAADAVADAVEDTRADEPPVQRIEPTTAPRPQPFPAPPSGEPTQSRLAGLKIRGAAFTTPLPPSAFPGAEPFVPSDS